MDKASASALLINVDSSLVEVPSLADTLLHLPFLEDAPAKSSNELTRRIQFGRVTAIMESLERLQGLHADLIAFAETRLANIERLWQELEETLEEFRNLLDNPPVALSDRDAYNGGKVSVDGQEYSINDDFKHIARALATALQVDELEAAKILLLDSGSDITADLDFIASSVGNFHERRDLLLQNLRLLFREAENPDLDENIRNGFLEAVKYVLDTKDGVVANASRYARKCLDAMGTIETRQIGLVNQLQNRPFDGDLGKPEYFSILEFQKNSLFKQHEALGCILSYLFRGDYTSQEDLRKMEVAATQWNRIDFYLLHYLPAFSAAFKRFGSADGMASLTLDQAKSLNSVFGIVKRDRNATNIDPFLAVLRLLWTAEHGGWLAPGKENEVEISRLSKQVKSSLDEFALEFLLAACSSLTTDSWRQPARQEMVDLLLSDAPSLTFEGEQPSHYFWEMFMESIEAFSEAWISNLPDSIRHLKNDEDDQRLLKITAMQQGAGTFEVANERTGPLHLECFLILISFGFEGRPEASEQWWEDPESNLSGFLQWASKRQTVPRVGAFCEMLVSIAEGSEGASAAHKFLLDESVPVPNSRTRRMPSLNYEQIFAEIELYSRKVHEKAPTSQLTHRKVLPTDMNESESPLMLSTYLRLLTHLCRHTSTTRDFIYSEHTLDLPRTLLLLSAGPVPSYLRASAFATLDALLTDKNTARAYLMWRTIDEWASNGLDMSVSPFAKPGTPSSPTSALLHSTLGNISLSMDQYDAFVSLLRNLLSAVPSGIPQSPELAFPEDLGASYRSAGVIPYIDFVCGQIFVKRLPEVSNETHAMRCAFHCLDLLATGLQSFNESYVAILDRGINKKDPSPAFARAVLYAQRHPFARLMEWVLGSQMNGLLMQRLHVSLSAIESASPESPLVQILQRSIDIVNLALDLQPTYFNLVRPLQKEAVQEKSVGVQSSMEDGILTHSNLILNLCQYAATEQLDLALRSLSLLQKLSGSTKMNNHFIGSTSSRRHGERVVDMLGPNAIATLRIVSEALVSKLQVSARELEGSYESDGYLMKDGFLSFLNACLETQPEFANVAHVLLGFTRMSEHLILPDSPETGVSVFDMIIELVRDYPHGEQSSYVSWLVHIKSSAMHTLRRLWSSPISAEITVSQLRRYRLLEALFAGQETVSEISLWDGKVVVDPDFWLSTAADTLTEVLSFRSAMYLYACEELQACATEFLPTLLKQHLSTMLGKSVDVSGMPISHLNIFELGDFLDIDLTIELNMPERRYCNHFDPEAYMTEATDERPCTYDIPVIQELLQIRQSALYESLKPPTSSQIDMKQVGIEAEGITALLTARNRLILARQAWRKALRSYADMVIAAIEFCPFESTSKVKFILQNLQLILPKLDALIVAESVDTIELARAADALMFALSSTTSNQSPTKSIITEKLFQLFRTCVDGMLMANSDSLLRSILYSIAAQYLTRITTTHATEEGHDKKARSNSMDTIRSSSLRLLNILADDAEDGSDACRLKALNLLALLTSTARSEKSTYILDALVKANILEILIEPLNHISSDFQNIDPGHRSYLLSIFEARMLLLLQISRTRSGATAILEAGLMSAVRDSLLFRADPDLGFSLPATSAATNALVLTTASAALHNYYLLLAPTLRLLLSTFTSRGVDNAQSQALARNFLLEYRPNMVGLLKRHLGINGKVEGGSKKVLGECVKSYVGLCVLCGFAEWEDETALEGLRENGTGSMMPGGFS